MRSHQGAQSVPHPLQVGWVCSRVCLSIRRERRGVKRGSKGTRGVGNGLVVGTALEEERMRLAPGLGPMAATGIICV
jgi:hypothetical protein